MNGNNNNNDFTVIFLKDQLKFLGEKIKTATMELEDKERVIQKLEHEKRDLMKNFENIELENFKMQEKLTYVTEEKEKLIIGSAK